MAEDADLFVMEHPPGRPPDPGAPVVVLVHGSMDRHTSFAALRRELADLHVVTYDRRGYGRSRHLPVAESLDDHVDDLLGILDGRAAVVLGHSYGGCIALRAGERAPDLIRALAVYESPLPWLPGWPTDTGGGMALAAADPETAAEAFLRRLLGEPRWETLPARAKAERRAEGEALVSDMRSIRMPARPGPPVDLAAVRIPVVCGRGEHAAPHHLQGMARLVELLPSAELVVVEGAAHGAHSAAPAAVARMVRRALTLAEPVRP